MLTENLKVAYIGFSVEPIFIRSSVFVFSDGSVNNISCCSNSLAPQFMCKIGRIYNCPCLWNDVSNFPLGCAVFLLWIVYCRQSVGDTLVLEENVESFTRKLCSLICGQVGRNCARMVFNLIYDLFGYLRYAGFCW